MTFSEYITIWIDADSCPTPVRELIFRFALRHQLCVRLVANRKIPVPQKAQNVSCIVTPAHQDAADNYIVEHVCVSDIVITRDIPLADRLIKKNITTINDRGDLFTTDNISEKLSLRNFSYELTMNGLSWERTNTFGKKELNNFANCFDRELQKKKRLFETAQQENHDQ